MEQQQYLEEEEAEMDTSQPQQPALVEESTGPELSLPIVSLSPTFSSLVGTQPVL